LWRIHASTLGADTERWQLRGENGAALGFGDVFSLWRDDDEFNGFWSSNLRGVRFTSYCWECPPVTSHTLTRPFECVFVSSPLLAELPADPRPFARQFRAGTDVVTFESLGKDALLVAPCPAAQTTDYAHLASFIASASQRQMGALWNAVGDALAGRVGPQPLWLSTAGLGVAWLHVRLDSRPKYYRHAPYRSADQRLR
jgi:hypothetical protein